MAEVGACLGVALQAKDKALKAECFSLAFGCIVATIIVAIITAMVVTMMLGFNEQDINR